MSKETQRDHTHELEPSDFYSEEDGEGLILDVLVEGREDTASNVHLLNESFVNLDVVADNLRYISGEEADKLREAQQLIDEVHQSQKDLHGKFGETLQARREYE
jgi:hypothetical protein